MKFRPLHDRIALRRVEGDTKTAGGIIIPDTAAEKPNKARSLLLVQARAVKTARSSRWS
jgi:co-chaperonin GroES (HSP10)